MKCKNLFLILCILSISSVLAAPTLNLQHEQIQPGETILATITTPGEFMEQIEKSQIKFFKGRKQTSIESDIFFYNNTHYLYIYTTQEENLTLQIENILYKEADTLQSTTIKQNLTIQKNILFDEETNETYTQILKIKPGFIFTSQTPKLKLTNMGTRTLNLTFNEEDVSLSPLSSEELEFMPQEYFSLTEVSTYKNFLIPTIYLTPQFENITSTIEPALKSDTKLLMIETFVENSTSETIEIFNFKDITLIDLKISLPMDFIEAKKLPDMSPRETQNLTLEFNPKTPGHFQGTMNISYTQNETKQLLQIPISVFILPKGEPVENFQIKEETCSELGGAVCETGTICNGTATFTKNAEYCCLATCVKTSSGEESEEGGFGWLIALLIFVVLGLVGWHFYKKQKQVASGSPEDSLKTLTEKIEKRRSPTSS